MASAAGKLSFKEKAGYSLGDVASNLYFQTFILFLTYFYTDVYGISASAVATLFLVTRIFDAVNDPLMGMIADRTNTRYGKFRPYIFWFAVPFGIVGVLTFTTPDFGMTGKLIYAYATYISLIILYTIVNVPYSALMGVLTPNSQERTVIASFRMVAAFVAGIIVQAVTMTLVKSLGDGNEQAGWQWAMTVLSAFAVILLLTTFFTTRERVKPLKERQSSFKQDFTDLLKNFPWVCIAIVSVFQLIMVVVRNGSIMYYFKYYVKTVELSLFGANINLDFSGGATTFMIIGTGLSIIAAIVTSAIAKKFDKRNTYLGMLLLFTAVSLLFYFFRPQDFVFMVLSQIFSSFSLGGLAVLQWAIYTDTADFGEWKTGRRATGLLMASSLFAIKLGLALGGAILGWLLAAFGFVPNVEQTPQALTGIRLCISVFPAIAAMICVIFIWFYPLKGAEIAQIEIDLAERRGKD